MRGTVGTQEWGDWWCLEWSRQAASSPRPVRKGGTVQAEGGCSAGGGLPRAFQAQTGSGTVWLGDVFLPRALLGADFLGCHKVLVALPVSLGD